MLAFDQGPVMPRPACIAAVKSLKILTNLSSWGAMMGNYAEAGKRLRDAEDELRANRLT